MQISKSLPKPQNWQDFETLCKKLWGEIWDCPEIKKNGRQGQAQNGVDVCGIPKGETAYFGIQCKGKDEYTNKNFTTKEIDREIEKAKDFKPKLKKLYFATTADKDSKIEEYIREINLENIKEGGFEIHLYCWGDIVELIFENRNTYNYYVNSFNFKDNYDAELTFFNDTNILELSPKFRKDTVIKISKISNQYNPRNNALDLLGPSFGSSRKEKINASLCRLQFKLVNTGKKDITNFKIILDFEGEVLDIVEDNKRFSFKNIISASDIKIEKEKKQVEIISSKKILVGDDIYISDDFFIRTLTDDHSIKINWKLLSSNFKAEGVLFLVITPQIINAELKSETDYTHEIGKIIEKPIEDYWD
ncbi:hypothetical protein [Chryseobacterium oryctis]|uniref:Restriction endonuclease n=1 Tax=Chryseobacterium oryctis TaxID=2952618 RepID=A0ABT3HP98_9FLAO|nr:hypothetical protein [Chryseobacterium oryctis]MCW3161606.1 hypothetical protein [Chryseobacterium oryctis]